MGRRWLAQRDLLEIMIYIFENDEYEKTVCVIETNEIINFYELFNEHKKEWYDGLKWSKEKYDTLV